MRGWISLSIVAASLALCGNFWLVGPAVEAPIVGPAAAFSGAVRAAVGGALADVPLFDFNPNEIGSGPGRLSDSLTFAGTAMELVASCTADDVSGVDLVCRTATGTVTLTETGSGVSPTVTTETHSPFTQGVSGVTTNSTGKSHSAGSNLVADEDLVIEVVYKSSGSNNRQVGGTLTSTTSAGFGITTTTSAISFRVNDGTNNVGFSQSGVSATAWTHGIAFIDDDADAQVCLNGTCSTNTAITAVGSWAGSGFTFGAFAEGGTGFATPIQSVRVWKCPAASPGCSPSDAGVKSAARASLARERSAKLWGAYPSVAAGDAVPSTMTRVSVAYVDHHVGSERRLALVGNNAPRVACRATTGGVQRCGYLSEPATTNLVLQSETIDNASWTKTQCAASANTTAAPNGATTADTLEATNAAGSVEHLISQAPTLTAATYTLSAYVKAGVDVQVTHAWLRNATVANAHGFIRLSDCTAGAKGVGASDLFAESWGDGWCRVGISFTGTAAAHTLGVGYSAADNTFTFDDGSDSDSDLIVWGVEVEAFPTMTSYQATTTASVTRGADSLRYASDNAATEGTFDVEFLCPSYASSQRYLAGIGSGSSDYAFARFNSVNDFGEIIGVTGGSVQFAGASGVDFSDGEHHSIRFAYATNDVTGWTDGVFRFNDTSATMQTFNASTRVWVGEFVTTTAQPACLITRVRAWDRKVTP